MSVALYLSNVNMVEHWECGVVWCCNGKVCCLMCGLLLFSVARCAGACEGALGWGDYGRAHPTTTDH